MKRHRYKIKEKHSILKGSTLVFLLLYTLSIIFMFGWGLMNSFKEDIEYYISAWNLPESFSLTNFKIAFDNFGVVVTRGERQRVVGIIEMCVNSFLYAGGCAIAQVTVICITAYLTARFDNKFSKVIYAVCFVCLILPIIGNTQSQLIFAKTFGLYDEIWGMWILRANFLSTYYLIFHAFFKSVPNAYYEAAIIDGANNFQILFKIVFPFAKKLFMTLIILVFIGIWNDYETPSLWLPNHPVIAVGLLNYNLSTASMISSTPMKLSGALLVSIPAFIVFFIFKDTLVGNITNGGLKE